MRTSIKILITALVLIVITLGFYDLQLKAEYLRGDFKNPFRDYVPANFSNFDSIDLQSGSAISLKVVKGPYKILIEPTAKDFIKITQRGRKLIFNATFKDHYRNINSEYVILVSCPEIKVFAADTWYTTGDWRITDSVSNDFNWKYSKIADFNTDSLRIDARHAANVVLENNRIGAIKVYTGTEPRTGSMITIGNGNSFGSGLFDINNKSTLRILSPAGNHINYQIADSAKLLLTGSISKQLFKSY